jgi:MFS family permease
LDLNTVFPALVNTLVDSKAVFGLLYAVMIGVPFVFNIFFGHFLRDKPRKKPYLLLTIYMRAGSFLGMAAFTIWLAPKAPLMLLLSLFGWIFVFSLSGGFASLSYADLIAKLTPKGNRGPLYAGKQFVSSVAMLLGGVMVARIFSLQSLAYPLNYSLVLAIGSVGLFVAAIAFWFIPEKAAPVPEDSNESLGRFLARVPAMLRKDREFRTFIVVSNLASFSLMLLPFYMIYARDSLGIGQEYIGRYLLFQMAGAIVSNLYWGRLSSRRGSKQVVRECLLVGGSIPVTALILQHAGPDAFSLVFFLIGLVMSGRKVGFEQYLLDIAPEQERTLYIGINGTLNFSRAILPVLGGVVIDLVGFTFTFVLTVVIMFVAYGKFRDVPTCGNIRAKGAGRLE